MASAGEPAQAPSFVRGDANADSRVDISDGVGILNDLFLRGVAPLCADAADTNDDGVVNITDAAFLFNALFLGGRPIPPPSGCGPDPTADALGCAVSNCDHNHPGRRPGIWISVEEILSLPMSGRGWANVKAAADTTPAAPNLGDGTQSTNVVTLAKALVFVRTGDVKYRNEVVDLCLSAIDTELAGSALTLGRELAAYVIAADLVGLDGEGDEHFRAWLRRTLTEELNGRTLRSTQEDRPNDWGLHAGASRAAAARYLGDENELAETAAVFKGWLGDRAAYAGFVYGDLSWQADPLQPVGVNPAGAMKDGYSIDGALPDEMRSAGPFQIPPPATSEPWEALQGAIVLAEILDRSGYDAWEWVDDALLRAVQFLYDIDSGAEGDDEWQVWLINNRNGTSFPTTIPVRPGKNMGWTDWTHGHDDGPEPSPDDPPGEPGLARGPYLQLGTPTSVVVRWRTTTLVEGVLRHGPSLDRLETVLSEGEPRRDHEIEVAGLSPGTDYYYSVGTATQVFAGADGSCRFRTAPPAGTATPTRIWVLGDSGTANSNARAVRDAYFAFAGAERTDLWLMLGDNAYSSGTDTQYQAAVFNMYPTMLRTSVLWPTLGNHDGSSANSSTQSGPYYDIFTLPTRAEAGGLGSGTEAYYSFDHANAHFICLDSNESDRSADGAMLRWLAADLAATDQTWIFAFWHHPPYSRGSHDSDRERQLVEMREHALPILEQGGVDLVLCGHSHSYERTYLLNGHYGHSSTLDGSMKLDAGDGRADGDGAYVKPSPGPAPGEGAVYVVAGSSGKTSNGDFDHPAMFLSLRELGSVVLDLNDRRLDVKFIDSHGAWRDYFTMVKGTPGP